MKQINEYGINCIKTFSGIEFDYSNPSQDQISIEDIAHALCMIPRWAGHTSFHYSVANHSVACAMKAKKMRLSKKLQFEALMHDAHEAYVLDLPSPLKKMLPEYKEIEQLVDKAIRGKFNMAYEIPQEIKEIDWEVLNDEWNYFNNSDIGQIVQGAITSELFLKFFKELQ